MEGQIYEATPYLPDQRILYHNESSQLDRWPTRQFFYCQLPAAQGGRTPVADCRQVYQRLDPDLLRLFTEKKLMYVRNFQPEVDVPWQEFFHTDDRAEVEASCRQAGLEIDWDGDVLQTRRVCPAVLRHPKTGEMVFFNQIQAHHISCVEEEVRKAMLSLFGRDNLPRNVRFGDGTPIDDEIVVRLIALYDELAISFDWRQGDLLVVDNILVAHARNAFEGERKVLVAMGDMMVDDAADPRTASTEGSTRG